GAVLGRRLFALRVVVAAAVLGERVVGAVHAVAVAAELPLQRVLRRALRRPDGAGGVRRALHAGGAAGVAADPAAGRQPGGGAAGRRGDLRRLLAAGAGRRAGRRAGDDAVGG